VRLHKSRFAEANRTAAMIARAFSPFFLRIDPFQRNDYVENASFVHRTKEAFFASRSSLSSRFVV